MKKVYKKIASLLIFVLFYQTFFPTIAMALSSGPSQPEYSSFSQVGVSDLVDHATGDFNYSLPLLELPANSGSLPIAINYTGVTNQEQEASSVGLGWNLNIGHINRDVIGYPDDFNKEELRYKHDRRDNKTLSISGGPIFELLGIPTDKGNAENPTTDGSSNQTGGTTPSSNNDGNPFLNLNPQVSIMSNSYMGVGFSTGIGLNAGLGPFSAGTGLSASSIDGYSMNANVQLSKKDLGAVGLNYSSGALGSSLNLNGSGLASMHFSYENPDLTPPRALDYIGTSITQDFQFGTEIIFSNASFTASLNTMIERLYHKNKFYSKEVCGAFYHHNVNLVNDPEVDMDYRREGTFLTNENTKQLALPILNADKFLISTPFFNDAFKVDYANFQTVRKARTSTNIGGGKAGGQIAGGNVSNVGIDGTVDVVNNVNNPKRFKDFENRTYKYNKDFNGWETLPSKHWLLQSNNGINDGNNNFEGKEALRTPFLSTFDSENHQMYDPTELRGSSQILEFENLFDQRYDENIVREYTNEKIINQQGRIMHPFLDVKFSTSFGGNASESVDREFGDNKLSAFTYHKGNGMKFFFGLPVLNLSKEEVTFGTNQTGEYNCNRITIDKDQIEKKNDLKYLDIIQTPSYAESFLLTTVVGPDFVDRDIKDGLPNPEDQGFWVNYEYTRTNDSENPYLWRFPFSGANVNDGVKSDDRDNTGNFVSGEREQYYVNRIKSATHELVFNYSARTDNFGAADKYQNNPDHGAETHRINSIELRSLENQQLLKTVHFKYSESGLCDGAENAQGGKLTLEQIYFTNYNSGLGASYPYSFEYYDSPYQMNITKDRWGFNKSGCSPYDVSAQSYDQNSPLPVWHLKKIQMPSGASIDVKISRDHYRTVESLQAGKMFRIAGLKHNNNNIIPENTNTDPLSNRVYFDIIGNHTNIDDYVKDLYRDGQYEQVYFRLQSDILNNDNYEIVDGYAHIKDIGYDETNNLGFLELKPMEYRKNKDSFHPFLVMNWHKLRNKYRQLMYSGILEEDLTLNDLKDLADKISLIFERTLGHYNTCITQNYGKRIDLDNSYIRLSNPSGFKIGGDVKVDKIIYSEASANNPNYGFSYDYTITNSDGSTISCGNTPSEPQLGSYANPDKYGIAIESTAKFAGNEEPLFQEMPIHKNHLLPSKVKYSQVTVKSLASDLMEKKFNNVTVDLLEYGIKNSVDINTLNLSTTGKTVYKYYTSEEFPSISEVSPVNRKRSNAMPLSLIFFQITPIEFAFNQGYYIEHNNMHGQLKGESRYSQSKTGEISAIPIYSKIINYQNDDSQIEWGSTKKNIKRLNNFIEEGEAGGNYYNTDYCTLVDLQYAIANNTKFGAEFNSDASVIGFPFLTGSLWPFVSIRQEILATSVVNQTSYKKGIISSIKVIENNAEIETFHDNYNQYTGQPQQVMVENEFDEFNVSLSTEAYKKYRLMGPASQSNYSVLKSAISAFQPTNGDCSSNYSFTHANAGNLVPGDFLGIIGINDDDDEIPQRHTYARIVNKIDNTYYLQIANFDDLNGLDNVLIKPLLSGYSNQMNASVKQRNLIKENKDDLQGDLISESITAYGNAWNTTGGELLPSTKSIIAENTYKPIYQFSEADNRILSGDITNSDLSRAGYIGTANTYSFGTIEDTYLGTKNGAISPVLNKVSESGISLEVVDRNFVYQTNLVGSLNRSDIGSFQGIKASASNSSYFETAFEGFEDSGSTASGTTDDKEGHHFTFDTRSSNMMKSYHIIKKQGGYYILNERFDNLPSLTPSKGLFFGTDGVNRTETLVDIGNVIPIQDAESGETLAGIQLISSNCNLLDEGENLQLHLFYIGPSNIVSEEIDTTLAHTGKHSLRLRPDRSIVQNHLLLVENKKYWASLWVFSTSEEPGITIVSDGISYPLNPVGEKINEWQKVEGEFLGSDLVEIISANQVLIDDVRIHTFNGSMQSFVYNDKEQLEYILDENNYFSKYHYDGEGRLIGISKETENGIRTISEQRQYTQK